MSVVELSKDEMFSSAIAGLPKVAEVIVALSSEDQRRALGAAERSYRETARRLGYQEADAVQWADAVMLRLRLAQPILAP
jgi:hypothetical protein